VHIANATTNKNMKYTNKQIKNYILNRYPDVTKVTITHGGEIIVHTTSKRGDGGKTPWLQSLGSKREFLQFNAEYI
jgi:hypothetical protein